MARRKLTEPNPVPTTQAADPYEGKTPADYPFTFHLFAHGASRSLCDVIPRNERFTSAVDHAHPALCQTCRTRWVPIEKRTYSVFAYVGQREPR